MLAQRNRKRSFLRFSCQVRNQCFDVEWIITRFLFTLLQRQKEVHRNSELTIFVGLYGIFCYHRGLCWPHSRPSKETWATFDCITNLCFLQSNACKSHCFSMYFYGITFYIFLCNLIKTKCKSRTFIFAHLHTFIAVISHNEECSV